MLKNGSKGLFLLYEIAIDNAVGQVVGFGGLRGSLLPHFGRHFIKTKMRTYDGPTMMRFSL